MKHGGAVIVSGLISSTATSCRDAETVTIMRRVHGTASFSLLQAVESDTAGEFSLRITPPKGADYKAALGQTSSCSAAESAPTPVNVAAAVSIAASDRTPSANFKIQGNVDPKHSGTKVILERKKGSRWVKVDNAQLNRASRYSFTVAPNWDGKRAFRVRWPSSDDDHSTGKSKKVVVTAS